VFTVSLPFIPSVDLKTGFLLRAIKAPGFELKAGTPNFILFPTDSKSHKNFLERHN